MCNHASVFSIFRKFVLTDYANMTDFTSRPFQDVALHISTDVERIQPGSEYGSTFISKFRWTDWGVISFILQDTVKAQATHYNHSCLWFLVHVSKITRLLKITVAATLPREHGLNATAEACPWTFGYDAYLHLKGCSCLICVEICILCVSLCWFILHIVLHLRM